MQTEQGAFDARLKRLEVRDRDILVVESPNWLSKASVARIQSTFRNCLERAGKPNVRVIVMDGGMRVAGVLGKGKRRRWRPSMRRCVPWKRHQG